MSVNTKILEVFDINPHEKKRVFLLMAKSFFIGIYVSYFFSFANGIFLSEFDIKYLPLAYVLSGVLGYLVSSIFSFIQKKIKFYDLLVGAMLFDLFLTILFVVGFRILADTKWLIFFLFICVGPIFSLINVSFWSLTNTIFDLREGKRLFGIIGTGGVVSSILSYFSIPIVIGYVGDSSNLMIIGILGLGISILIQLVIMRTIPEARASHQSAKKKTKGPGLSMKAIFTNKYFRFIFLLVIFSMLSQYFVDYSFMGVARMEMQDEIQLTSFFGIFYGLAKIVELLFRTLAAGRLMSKYGVILGLLLLPILLLSFTSIALVGYFFTSGFAFLFLLFAMIKLTDNVVRRSMDEPAVKTLYQPVEASSKMMLQTTIEGKGKQLAVIISGSLLMLFSLSPSFSITIAAVISCVLIVVWIQYAYRTYKEYRELLNHQLTDHSETDDNNNANQNYYLHQGITSEQADIFEKSINATLKSKPDALVSILPNLIRIDNINLRRKALMWAKKLPLFSYLKPLEEQAKVETDNELLDLILEAIQNITYLKNLSEQDAKDLLISRNKEDRIKAAAWICQTENRDLIDYVDSLQRDTSLDVVKATSFYISRIQNVDYVKSLIQVFIENKSYEHSFIKTMMLHTNHAQDLLEINFASIPTVEKFTLVEEAFRSSADEPLSLISLIKIVGEMNNPYAMDYLKTKINKVNGGIQYYILDALKGMHYKAEENDLTMFRQLILRETSFCSWLLASKRDLRKGSETNVLIDSLDDHLEGAKKKILNILSFLYPSDAISKIEKNIKSGIPEKEVMALEMVDILLDEVHKDLVFPLFDKISVVEKVKNLSQHFPQAEMSHEERLKQIIFYDYAQLSNVTKAFAMQVLQGVEKHTSNETIAQIYSADQMLKEVAYSSILRNDEQLFEKYINTENSRNRIFFSNLSRKYFRNKQQLSRLEIVQHLKNHPIFMVLPYWKLSLVSRHFNSLFLPADNHIELFEKSTDEIQFFIHGEVILYSQDQVELSLQKGDIVGYYDRNIFERKVNVQQDALFLTIPRSKFYLLLNGLNEVSEKLYKVYISKELTSDESDIDIDEMFIEYVS